MKLIISLGYLTFNRLTLSPSATSQIFSSVTGFMVANVFPLAESTYSLLMKSCLKKVERNETGQFHITCGEDKYV